MYSFITKSRAKMNVEQRIKDGYATLAELDVTRPRIIDHAELHNYSAVMEFFDWSNITGTLSYDDGSRWYTRSASPTYDHAVYERYDK